MRKLAAVAVALAAILVVSTCLAPAADGATKSKNKQYGEPREGEALIYMVRRGFMGGAVSAFVFSDKSLLSVLEGSCYGFAHVAPGEHLLWLSHGAPRLAKRFEIEANRTYYFDLGTQILRLDDEWGAAAGPGQ